MRAHLRFLMSCAAVPLAACLIDETDYDRPAEASSCAGLAATCGLGGGDDCCLNFAIPEGMYYRSYDVAGDARSGDPSEPATVSQFRLDKYEVTVARFRAFVDAGMGTQASPPKPGSGAHKNIEGSGWDASWNASLAVDRAALIAGISSGSGGCTSPTWTDTPGANEGRPINCVSWYEAMAFCIWDGGYLPTEAEWNYAASGGDEQRAYPWSIPAGMLTPLNGSYTSYDCGGDGMQGCAPTDLVAVGTKPRGDGKWGQSDLVGNVCEWTLDAFAAYPMPCNDCASLSPPDSRVTRGGNYTSLAVGLRVSARLGTDPTSHLDQTGLRCARRL